MCKALDIAKFIVSYENSNNRIITNLRLQKLLYFIQADFYAEKGVPCFEENMEAWKYGPVVPEVYRFFHKFGKLNDPVSIGEITATITDDVVKLIKSLLDQLAFFSTEKLISISHNQKPWMIANNREDKIITHAILKETFCNA